MSSSDKEESTIWRIDSAGWMTFGIVAVVLSAMFYEGAKELVRIWTVREEYSYGFLVPAISLFLVWQKRDQLERLQFNGAWAGVAFVALGVAVFFLGELSTLFIIVHYAMIVVLAGLVLSYTGWRVGRLLVIPLIFLVFMIPLPPFLYNRLSGVLQLISSELGVEFIRWFGISVFLEGNVIDLGTYKLQVVEACNGLRYLFPLMTFGFICAYFFRAPLWQRAVVFLTSIPITVLMNSIRIGIIGVLVEHWGTEMAEGFLHEFEGWVIFMTCVAVLLGEMWLFNRFTGERRSFRDVFSIDLPGRSQRGVPRRARAIPKPFIIVCVALTLAALATVALGKREEVMVERASLTEFPLQLGEWRGRRNSLEDIYLSVLKLTDYIISDYQSPAGDWVNFYVAYYSSQRKGGSAHSPRSCIPGGGWEIRSISSRRIDGASAAGQTLVVNRVEIQRQESKQLVYYWFQQRGRLITSEYRVKAYLLWDAITRRRTDGAMIRLTTELRHGEDWAVGDERLTRFARALDDRLQPFIPD